MHNRFEGTDFVLLTRNGMSLGKIAEIRGVTLSAASLLFHDLGENYNSVRSNGLKDALELVKSHHKQLYEIRQNFGFSPSSFYDIISGKFHESEIFRMERPLSTEEVFVLRANLGDYSWPVINDLIDRAYSYREISLELTGENCFYQKYEQFIKGSGQWTWWARQRILRKQRIIANKRSDNVIEVPMTQERQSAFIMERAVIN
jgi:hypothetical protein